tara:strand:- start:4445 stop:6304 length:1860 start_codon:yes stop_codon:yes gene_type:complete
MNHLLPSSSTQFERDLSESIDVLSRLGTNAEGIRTSKFQNINETVLGWLIYEYGLGEILPYVPDTQRAVAEGIAWQRIRGTKAAVATSLSWIDFAATIEESEAGTINWADFQLGLDAAPNGLEFTDNVIQVTKLSSPIRSKLFRVYSTQFDFRRFWLNDTELSSGSWLSDHTGVYLYPEKNWPQLSFGRNHQATGNLDFGATGELGILRRYTDHGAYEDRTLLDIHRLGDNPFKGLHISDVGVTISRLISWTAGPWWYRFEQWNTSTETWLNQGHYSWQQAIFDWIGTNDYKNRWESGIDWAGLKNNIQIGHSSFSKAGIYLSDYSELGDTNTCFNPRFKEEFGFGAIQLSEGDPTTGEGILSEHVSRLEFSEITERFERQTEIAGLTDTSVQTLEVTESSRSGATIRRITEVGNFVLSEEGELSEFVPVPVLPVALDRTHTDLITETFWPHGVDSEHKKFVTIIFDYSGQAGIAERLHTRSIYATWVRFITNNWVQDDEIWSGVENGHLWHGDTTTWMPSDNWQVSIPWTSDTHTWEDGGWETVGYWNTETGYWGQTQWHTYSGGWSADEWVDLSHGDWQSGQWTENNNGWNVGDWVGELQAWNPSTLTIETKHTTTN